MAKDLTAFQFSSKVKKQLKDKAWLKQELVEGKTLQEIVNFSDEVMDQFYHASYQLFEQKRYLEAADAFLFLATFNPHHHNYWLGLGMSTQMLHNYEEAIDAYELAALCEMDNPISYFYLAKCLFAIHDRQSALQALELAIEAAGDDEQFALLKDQAEHARQTLIQDNQSS